MSDQRLLHVCEACGLTLALTPDEAFESGWDYPPRMGVFGVVSPRTCGDCRINQTLWWRLEMEGVAASELGQADAATLARILGEPESILLSPGEMEGDGQ